MVLTGGSLAWDATKGDFDWSTTDAMPESLRGRLREEPLWVDLTWVKRSEDLSSREPRFQNAVADLAATLHGRPKDEIFGEDVRTIDGRDRSRGEP